MDLRTLLVEIKTFLLGLSRLEDEQNGKRVQILGSLEIWLYRLPSIESDHGRVTNASTDSRLSSETVITEKSYESIVDRNTSYISTSIYDEYQDGVSSSESNEISNIGSGAEAAGGNEISGRRDTQSEQLADSQNSQSVSDQSSKSSVSTYSTSNITGTDQPAKHTGRLWPSLNLLRKAVTKPQPYYAALLSDRLVLSKSIRDMRPWQEIRLYGDSVCEQQGKLGIRITEPLISGRIQSHSFSCQNSTEAHTWVDVINEVIRRLRNAPCVQTENSYSQLDESDFADSDECLSTLSLDSNTSRQKNNVVTSLTKSMGRKWVRRFSKEAIRHPLPEVKIPLSQSPFGPSPIRGGGIGGELLVRATYLNQSASGQSVSRHCRVANGLFSVFLKSDSPEPEFTFPLQCCELVADPEATNKELKFRIVQGSLEKVSCEAFDQMSHINWLKHLANVIGTSRTVPDQLLDSCRSGQSNDEDEEPEDEYDDYQIPISLKRFKPGIRQALQSIRQSFTDEEAMSAVEGVQTHRSQQNLHHREASTSATNVKRSHSTRPLYNLTSRQNLQTKAYRRLLPDIEHCLDLTEERFQEGDTFDDYNGDAQRATSPENPATPPVSQPRCESAIYVDATPIPPEHSSTRSSGSNYSSASAGRGSNYSSGVGSGGGRLLDEEEETDDLLLSTSHYTRSPSRPVSHVVGEETDENIYEDVQPIMNHSPVTRTMTDVPSVPSHSPVTRAMTDGPATPRRPPVTRAKTDAPPTPSRPPLSKAVTDAPPTPSRPPLSKAVTDASATLDRPPVTRAMTDSSATPSHPPVTRVMTNGPPPKPPSSKPRRARTFNSNDAELPPSAFLRDLTAAVAAKAKSMATLGVDAHPEVSEKSVDKVISSTQSSPSKKSTTEVDREDVTVTSSPSDSDILSATQPPPKLPPKPRKLQRSPYVGQKPVIQAQRDGKSTTTDDCQAPAVDIKNDLYPIDAS